MLGLRRGSPLLGEAIVERPNTDAQQLSGAFTILFDVLQRELDVGPFHLVQRLPGLKHNGFGVICSGVVDFGFGRQDSNRTLAIESDMTGLYLTAPYNDEGALEYIP